MPHTASRGTPRPVDAAIIPAFQDQHFTQRGGELWALFMQSRRPSNIACLSMTRTGIGMVIVMLGPFWLPVQSSLHSPGVSHDTPSEGSSLWHVASA